MSEILANAQDRFSNHQILTPAQHVVLAEWLKRVSSRRGELELHAQYAMLSDDQYAELAACREVLDDYQSFRPA